MPICSCGFTIRGFFISHSVPICDSRQIMWHLHYLYHKMLWFCWSSSFFEVGGVFFACIGVGERKVILFIMLYYWHQNLVFLTYMLSNWSSSIPFVFFAWLSQCRMSSDTSQGSNDVNSFNAWKWKYSKNFSFVMHT